MSERVESRPLMRGAATLAGVADILKMNAAPAVFPSLAQLPRLLAAAPHRLLFFAGASSVMVSMTWWTSVLLSSRMGLEFPAAPVPAGWAHAVLTQYGMLSMFIFGFLLTVFPRWLNQPALTRRHYVPVFAGVFGGYLLAHAGLLDMKPLLLVGLASMLCGWLVGLITLGRVLLRSRSRDRFAWSCYAAVSIGACGLAAFVAFALGAPWWMAVVAIKLGTFGLLVPIYVTVCLRMIPFFSANVVGHGYRKFQPAWTLPLMWFLLVAHCAAELAHRFAGLWLLDVPLAILFATLWWGWQPWKCLKPGLLAALYLAFAWLPVAFTLFAAQSLILAISGQFVLGRAPVHALTIGFFGSMLVAMVTRVTMGHSGRPLQMGAIAWLTFGALQLAAVARIAAELSPDAGAWLIAAAFGWLLAFAPWIARTLWIYFTPRVDGHPG